MRYLIFLLLPLLPSFGSGKAFAAGSPLQVSSSQLSSSQVSLAQGNSVQDHSTPVDSTQAATIVDESAKEDQHYETNSDGN